MLENFFHKYFVEPIQIGYGYNMINTLVYAFLFVFFTYLIYNFLKKLNIKIDIRFILSVTPWIVFGTMLRILEDMGVITSYLLVKFKIPFFKIMFASGIIFVGIIFPFFRITNFPGLIYFSVWFIPWLMLLKIVKWSVENKIVTLLHLFDATVTFVSLQYFNYFEQHVLPRTIIELTGTPFSFVIVKLVVIVAVLNILDKYSDDKEFTNYLKIIIGILGFATGLRDLLRLILLV